MRRWRIQEKWSASERFLGSPGFAERTYWMREGFGRLNELTSPGTTVQYNPVRDEVSDFASVFDPTGCDGRRVLRKRLRRRYCEVQEGISQVRRRSLTIPMLCGNGIWTVFATTSMSTCWWQRTQIRYGMTRIAGFGLRPSLVANPSMRADRLRFDTGFHGGCAVRREPGKVG